MVLKRWLTEKADRLVENMNTSSRKKAINNVRPISGDPCRRFSNMHMQGSFCSRRSRRMVSKGFSRTAAANCEIMPRLPIYAGHRTIQEIYLCRKVKIWRERSWGRRGKWGDVQGSKQSEKFVIGLIVLVLQVCIVTASE